MEATNVRLGDFNYGSNKDDASPIDLRVSEIIIHPNFTANLLYNNIGLLRLNQSIEFSAHIRPACLPQFDKSEMEKAIMAGWIFKLYSVPVSMRHKQDKQLRKYDMKIISIDECKQIYSRHTVKGMPNGVIETQICASIIIEAAYSESHHFKMLKPLEV